MRRFFRALGVCAGIGLTAGMLLLSFTYDAGSDGMVGVIAAEGAVSIQARDQLGAQDSLVIDEVTAPGPSWIAVYTEGMEEGMPGERVGLLAIPAGVSSDLRVPLDASDRLTENVVVVVHADAGLLERFEYDPDRFDSSPDKPYWVGGKPVERRVWVRFDEMGNSFRS